MIKKCGEKGNSIGKIAETYNVHVKSLRRWIKNGPENKIGAGRKIKDPEMEKFFNRYVELKDDKITMETVQEEYKLLMFNNRDLIKN